MANQKTLTQADQFWSADDPESCYNSEQELAYEIADNLLVGEDATVKVYCSKRLPDRKLFVTATEENGEREVVWRWLDEKKSDFQRENRYIVLKISDYNQALSHAEISLLAALTEKVDNYRRKQGKDILQAVVVEHDWPEYESVWQAIEERVRNAGTA